jgi:hypothetical protein
MTSKILTSASIIEIVPDNIELSLMSFSVISKTYWIPSTIDSSPFCIMKYKSC